MSVATNGLESVATLADCSHKKDGVLRVRVPMEEMGAWKEQAAKEGKLLSEWVRETLNGTLESSEVMPSATGSAKVASVETGEHRAVAKTSAKRYCRHGLMFCRECQELARAES